MSGGGALAFKGKRFYGIRSLVDLSANEGGAITTYVFFCPLAPGTIV
jgi:hypothetical protein